MTDEPSAAVERIERVPGDVPPTWQALMRLAARVAPTTFVPKPLRGNPGEVLACMMYGAELGLSPITSLRSIHVIDGQPTCSAQLMRALIQRAGHMLSWREVTAERVVLYGRRRDTGSDATVTWTLEDAKTAKLLGKGNWATYPRAMLAARATTEIARLLFADELHGLAYTPEEVGAVGPYDAIDIEYMPTVDDTPAPHVVAAAALDVDDQLDAQWLEQAGEQ
jgi:hypothetical protein